MNNKNKLLTMPKCSVIDFVRSHLFCEYTAYYMKISQ